MGFFEDKVAVITGAGSGIGRATAEALAARGARVHVVDIDEARANEVANIVHGTAHALDCSDPQAMEDLAQRVLSEGPVHIVHNNAGVGHAGAIEETSLEEWDRVLSINLRGTVHGVHAFVPRLLAQYEETGIESHLINTASVLGLVGVPGFAPYCASKYAIVGMTEVLAMELRGRGVHPTVVCPGIISTNIVRDAKIGGRFHDLQSGAVNFYDRFGSTPERVAKDVLHAIRHKVVVQPSPRHQVLPLWLASRVSGAAYRTLASLATRRLLNRG